jgi:hypothetical protein
MANLVQYGKYNPQKAKEERAKMKGGGDNRFMKLAVGKNIVRVLPPPAGAESPFNIVKQHYIKIDGDERPFVFTCPRSLPGGRKCPACARGNELKGSGNPKDKEKASGFWPNTRIFCNVVDRQDPDAGPKVLAFGKSVYEELVKYAEGDDDDPDFEPVDFTDPMGGFDIAIIRTGTAMDTRYKVKLATKPTKLHPEVGVMNGWITSQHNLEEFSTLPSDEDILSALEGVRPETKRLETRQNRQLSSGGGKTSKPAAKSKKDDTVDADFDEVDADDFADDTDDFKDE